MWTVGVAQAVQGPPVVAGGSAEGGRAMGIAGALLGSLLFASALVWALYKFKVSERTLSANTFQTFAFGRPITLEFHRPCQWLLLFFAAWVDSDGRRRCGGCTGVGRRNGHQLPTGHHPPAAPRAQGRSILGSVLPAVHGECTRTPGVSSHAGYAEVLKSADHHSSHFHCG